MTATAAITAQALRLLAAEIQTPDDVPACCLRDAADQLADQAAEIKALRSAMLSALSATRAKVDGDVSTEWLCLGADEIRACIRRIDRVATLANERADKAEARVKGLEELLREIRDSYHDNRAGGWRGAGDMLEDAVCRIDAVLAKRDGGR